MLRPVPDPTAEIVHPDLTMPGIFDTLGDDLPLRHRPTINTHDNVWRTACDTICWDFAARRYVLLHCAPCPACLAV
ncbi:MAG TPA: hypothetical protein VFW65_34730 [Pseudonocardiaceae bacterium]|nr:hypothetical protein [Pseudonocardiaceae bacterium]